MVEIGVPRGTIRLGRPPPSTRRARPTQDRGRSPERGPTSAIIPETVRIDDEAREARRIAALRAYKILDTPPEQTFDDIAKLAAHIFDAPKAAVTLVDRERQWFKARVNMEERETDLSISFCVNAVRDQSTLIVDDASTHPRFAHYPNVACEGGVRFYVGAPLIDPEGNALGTVCVFDSQAHPVTPDKVAALEALAREAAARLELRKAVHAMAESARSRKELLDLLAHEVSGAVAPVVMCTELLELDGVELPGESAELLDVVRRNAQLAGQLARDIQELARIEGDRLTVERLPLDTRDLLQHAAGAMRRIAASRGVDVRVHPPSDGAPRVLADERRITQVLTNLLGNAIKFTPERGHVTLSATHADGMALITVADTGQGLTPEQAARLFQRFSQVGHRASDGDPGNGLGLFICRQLVEAHGGRIWTESDGEGRGTKIHFTLPLA